MRLALALVALLALAACHRRSSEVMPGADAEARRATAQQTIEDLAAAGDAPPAPIPLDAPLPSARARPVLLIPDAGNDNAAAPAAAAGENGEEAAPAGTR